MTSSMTAPLARASAQIVRALAEGSTGRGLETPEPVGPARQSPPPGWREEAACRGVDPDLFFPAGTTGLAEIQIVEARRVCWACPALDPCLEFSLAENQQYGIWGGMTEDERRILRNERRRQRALTGP